MRGVCTAHGAREVRTARDEAERAALWKCRKRAFGAVGRLAPNYCTQDGVVPRTRVPEILKRIAAAAERHRLRIGNVFHAGDGNIHPCIFYDANLAGDWERAEEMGGRVLERCVELGGTITGEHGVGVEKLRQMCVQFRAPELRSFHDVKAAFDPDGILNPGKAVPTLKRCAEWGGMHVRGGRLPRADIPRF